MKNRKIRKGITELEPSLVGSPCVVAYNMKREEFAKWLDDQNMEDEAKFIREADGLDNPGEGVWHYLDQDDNPSLIFVNGDYIETLVHELLHQVVHTFDNDIINAPLNKHTEEIYAYELQRLLRGMLIE